MITFVRGKLREKKPTSVVIENNGVGLEISVPTSTSKVLIGKDETVFLLTHLYVKEDALRLFGFATEDERELFRHLLSVSGVGPRLALTILSGVSIPDFYKLITQGNDAALTAIPGIGKKTAQRLIVDLKDKVASKMLEIAAAPSVDSKVPPNVANEAILALVSLGYAQTTAQKAVEIAVLKSAESVTVEELITASLRYM
jgi:Holliday junction DNA helicase RuvA